MGQREIEKLYGKLAEFGDAKKWLEQNQTIQALENEIAELAKQRDRYFDLACRYKSEIDSTRERMTSQTNSDLTTAGLGEDPF
ncbi:hypothetical protein [Gloeobacter morelensis]|uniref:Uncharacterized protein n=1 Tax=Gloeobacter morelensis MG652769 TaxID=2781736 RepID=A0ABY3PQ98_9CYAN|nr:hypothetical protein [Gloeobacter morelensis]UFP95820.1 hypothetical protein ISF26_06190 [Gloeobacter morelensis MG652769]